MKVYHECAPDRTPDPAMAKDVVAEYLLGHGGHQSDCVGNGQADQVAVCGGVHGPAFEDDTADENVAKNTDEKDDTLQNNFVQHA